MNEPFDIPVTYKGNELLFPAHLRHLGYIHTFVVDVNGREIIFEPDEEQHYRAIIDLEKTDTSNHIDIDLLKAIAEAISEILK